MTSTPVHLEGKVDPDRGFLPSPDPLTELPADYAAWDELGHSLPKLLATQQVRHAVSRLPTIDASGLPDDALTRAMLVLSFLGHAYIYQSWQAEAATSLPAAIAVPWATVARRLGRPPILSYASYALDNWRRIDSSGPIALGNLALLQNFLGGLDEEWFVTVHVQIEAQAAPLLHALTRAVTHDSSQVRDALETIHSALQRMHQTLLRMPENCDPYIYYHRVRPFIHGWQQHPVVYEGVSEHLGTAQAYYGETGAQSTIVPCLDAVLGIRHQRDELRTYLLEMRRYMPPGHVAFLEELERAGSVRDTVVSGGDSNLQKLYDSCVEVLEGFRSTHLDYAARYIQKQAQVGVNSTEYGTGGTPFMRYLKKHRNETTHHRLDGSRRNGGPEVAIQPDPS